MSVAATQAHIPVASLEEGVVIMKDGSLAVILRVYPINFDLKNESEQNTIIAKYQQFLNSLEYPIQILVRSKQLDLKPYLNDLVRRTASLESELLQRQARDYIDFMNGLVEAAEAEQDKLMTKQYYVVLQYHRMSAPKSGGILPIGHKDQAPTLTRGEFERIRTELNNRANNTAGMLIQLGLRLEALDTQQLIELFYSVYNPDIANTERLVNVDELHSGVVHAEGSPLPTAAAPTTGSPGAPAPGLTGSGDAIQLNPEKTAVEEAVPVAAVPDEAAKAATEEHSKIPTAEAATAAPAQPPASSATPASPPSAVPQPDSAATPTTAAPPADADQVELNVPPT